MTGKNTKQTDKAIVTKRPAEADGTKAHTPGARPKPSKPTTTSTTSKSKGK